MTPTVNELAENETTASDRAAALSGTQGAGLQEGRANDAGPAEADMAIGGGHRLHRNAQPAPPAGLQIELEGRAGEAKLEGGISEGELMSLLEDAHNPGTWSDIRVPSTTMNQSRVPPMPSSAKADHAAGNGQARPTHGETDPSFPPPDLEPAAAKKHERQLGQSEIDALLAQLLGG